MFGKEEINCKINEKDGSILIQELTTKFPDKNEENENEEEDHLSNVIGALFDNEEILPSNDINDPICDAKEEKLEDHSQEKSDEDDEKT